METGTYKPVRDAEPARWLIGQLQGFSDQVLSVVPAGFEAYARVFHPARRHSYPSGCLDEEKRCTVSWHTIAEYNGQVAHRRMQWPAIVGAWECDEQPSLWDEAPADGHLPQDLAVSLVAVLAKHTLTGERCYAGVWDGYGGLAVPVGAATFEIPHRQMHLLSAPLSAIPAVSLKTAPFWQTPNIWWPADRAWCVHTDIDFASTYIGAPETCIDSILESSELETVSVEPTDGIDVFSDNVNALPPRPEQAPATRRSN